MDKNTKKSQGNWSKKKRLYKSMTTVLMVATQLTAVLHVGPSGPGGRPVQQAGHQVVQLLTASQQAAAGAATTRHS